MKVQIINKSKHPLPKYETEQSAGMDIRANLTEPIVLKPLQRCLVPTGLYMALPKGFEAQIRPRSGLAIKKGIGVLNSPGTIDADYRGEVKVILVNLSNEPFVINPGERIAQMVVAKYEKVEWEEVETLDETERGTGGFGSTCNYDFASDTGSSTCTEETIGMIRNVRDFLKMELYYCGLSIDDLTSYTGGN